MNDYPQENQYYQPRSSEKQQTRRAGISLSTNTKFGIIFVLILMVLGFIGHQMIIGTIVQDETNLNTQFAKCQRALGDYYNHAETVLGIAKANSEKLVEIINAVSTHNPTFVGAGVPGLNRQNSPVYVQLLQAYPDLKQSSQFYANAQAIMVGDYSNYSAVGNDMSDMVGHFNNDLHGSWGFLYGGYPDDTLTARVGTGRPAHGQAALDLMSEVITDQKVSVSYDKGYTSPVLP